VPTFEITGVTDVKVLDAARLWLRFSDGLEGVVDLARESSAFPESNDSKWFAQVTLAGGGLAWPGGFDCAPEWLHERVAAAKDNESQPNDDGWESLHRQLGAIPEISRFFGIVIRMFYSGHARPHFHAEYGEYAISIEIDGDGIHGRFPPARLPMLFEWRENWERLRRGEAAVPILPLA
jgi:hypothetical protein